jgi:hypothetical protein
MTVGASVRAIQPRNQSRSASPHIQAFGAIGRGLRRGHRDADLSRCLLDHGRQFATQALLTLPHRRHAHAVLRR